jgi:hypothetical protein
MSVKFSGDTEAFSSDPSVDVAGMGRNDGSGFWAILSSTSLSTWDTMAGLGPALRRSGFEMGELLIPDFPLALAAFGLRVFLTRSRLLLGGGGSRSISTGELLEWLLGSYADELSWAWSAGEVRGLKYAPGTVNVSFMLKWGSSGVTAGDTSGVKAIF